MTNLITNQTNLRTSNWIFEYMRNNRIYIIKKIDNAGQKL